MTKSYITSFLFIFMQTKFRRHQKVKLLVDPDKEYIEPSEDYVEKKIEIKKGMTGKINIVLPNGQYHVGILDSKENIIAYVVMSEDDLEGVNIS